MNSAALIESAHGFYEQIRLALGWVETYLGSKDKDLLFAAADTPGSVYTVSFNPNGTSLSDGTGTVSYPFTTVSGVLTVAPAAVPEASSVVSLGLLLGLSAAAVRRRKAAAVRGGADAARPPA